MTGSPYAAPTAPAGNGGYGQLPAAPGVAAAAAPGAPKYDTININGHTNLRLTLNVHAPTAPDPWVTSQVCILYSVFFVLTTCSQAMPHINHSLRQAGHSDTVADELTRALGLLAAHGVRFVFMCCSFKSKLFCIAHPPLQVLQLTQSACTEPVAQQGWAGEQQAAATSYSSYGSSSGYGGASSYQPPAPMPAPRPPAPSSYQVIYFTNDDYYLPLQAQATPPRPADYPAPASPPGPPGEVKPTVEREMQVNLPKLWQKGVFDGD